MRDVLSVRVIVISVIVMGIAIMLPSLSRLRQRKKHALILYAIFVVYLLGNLYFTLLTREEMPKASYELELFSAYRRSFQLDSGILGTIRRLLTEGFPAGIQLQTSKLLEGIFLNILLYVPMGYLLPMVWPKLGSVLVILIGFLSSLLTESIQLVFHLGLFEVDDLFNNTLGTIFGVLLYLLLMRKGYRALLKKTDAGTDTSHNE